MLSLSRKIIVRYTLFLVFIAIFPLLLIGIVSYKTSSLTLQETESRFSQELLSHQKELLTIQLVQVENLIANISGVETITRALDDRNVKADTYTSLATQAQIGYILNGYLHLEGLVSIDIFTEGGAHYHVGDTLDVGKIRESTKSAIEAQTLASGQQVYWAGVVPNVNEASNYDSVLTAAHMLTTTDRHTLKKRPLAILMVNYSIGYIRQYLSKVDLGSGVNVALLDQHGNTIYSKDPDGGRLSVEIVKPLLKDGDVPEMVTWNEQLYLLHSLALENFGWQLVSMTPENVLLSGVKTIREVTVWLLLISFLVVGLAAWFFSRNIVQPIRDVIGGYQTLHEGALDSTQRLPVRSNDEIGELVQWYNSFLDNLALQKVSEDALRVSEERYALVINATLEGLWDWDLESNKMYFSPRFFSLLGLNPLGNGIQNVPQEWFGRIHSEDQFMVRQEVDKHLAGHSQHFQCEHRLLHEDGSYHWVLSHGLAVRDKAGKAVRMAGSHSDITDRKEAESKLRHYAYHDNLTGLKNRAWFVSYLLKALHGQQSKNGAMFAVLFLDLDQFKIVNDTLGHPAGDELLIKVADRIKACLRDTDQLARLGGDEFVVLLEQTDDYDVLHVADRILKSLASPFLIKEQWVQTGASMGIAFSTSGYKDPDDMLRDADIAMYQAKVGGKNRFIVFDEEMRGHLLKHIALEQDLIGAIKQGGLELFYQPIFSFSSGRLIGCEALIRWDHKSLGVISPEEFIPIAESSNLMHALGQWILEAACCQWRKWDDEFGSMEDLLLSINISALQFHDEQFIESIPQVLSDFNIDGSNLAFEITETAIIQNTMIAEKVITEFKKLGIRIHLDDFGTGFSSLSHLANFSIDLIKIDRSFVMQCTEKDKQKNMVLGIINLAHELGIKSTAEGVETQAQWALLKEAHCDHAQGFYFSKPLCTTEMGKLFFTSLTKGVSAQSSIS